MQKFKPPTWEVQRTKLLVKVMTSVCSPHQSTASKPPLFVPRLMQILKYYVAVS